MKCVAVLVWLSCLLPLGRSASESNRCDSLLKPIAVSNEEMLGKWIYIGGSSNIPGSRSLAHMMSSAWLNLTVTSQSNVLNLVQTQKMVGQCSSISYDVIFENSTMVIEKPFYLKEIYLPTECPDCLVAAEEIVSGPDEFTSLLMFSRSRNVPPAALEMLREQAECLEMVPPIILDPNHEMCPDNIPRSDGLSALNSLLEAKTGQRVARFLDAVFDFFVN
ncbi:uncharacterized protein LOC101159643 [Oryzias latipes]|uniref:uncharacterized protein LOC101159643 n=1 Tax=Oryzias latipes TaxID=8090 RepID=UPI0000EA0A60|nr:uncharacterized protein LOC101159643 [Oryzias latipes]